MQEFYLADYQDDENELLSHQDTSKLTHIKKHIIITGWSEKDGNSLNDSFSTAFSFCGTYQLSNSRCGFYCLDIWLSAGDDGISGLLINHLRPLLKCCLKCFNNYINIALAYEFIKKENSMGPVKISYYYQTRVTGNELEHQIKIIRAELGKPVPQNINNAHVYKDISNQYFSPGIELVSGNSIDNSDSDFVLKYLIDSIKKSNLFFDLPYSVLSNTFHLYHHPKRSFPLPILLKSSQDMEKAEFWKGIDWEDDYKDYRDDFNNCKKYIVLGYYTRDNEDGCEGPHIVLCPENIEAAAFDSNLKDKKELLYLIVLIHELAHAMMDKNNVTMNSLFSNAMEESLANMITLQWFDVFDNDDKEIVKDFLRINNQRYTSLASINLKLVLIGQNGVTVRRCINC